VPWNIWKNGDEFCIYKENPDGSQGEAVEGGCHQSRDEAERQLAALYASESKAVVAVKSDSDEWVLDVLGVPYGSPDDRDAYGEYFTKETALWLDRIPKRPVVYYHGLDEKQGDPEVIGKELGWEKRADGVWFRVLLDKTKDLARRVWRAAKDGLARASSGAISHLVRQTDDGEIVVWPIGELSLFDAGDGKQPANRHAVALPAAKSLYERAGITLPAFESSELSTGGPSAKETGRGASKKKTTIITEELKMDWLEMLKEKFLAMLDEIAGQIGEADQEIQADTEEMLDDEEQKDEIVEGVAAKYAKEAAKDTGLQQVADGDKAAQAAALDRFIKARTGDIMRDIAEEVFGALEAHKRVVKIAVGDALNTYKSQAEPEPGAAKADKAGAVTKSQPQISVSESLKYAHLSAEEMALVVKLRMAAVQDWQRPTIKMGDMFSEDFARHAYHKAITMAKALDPSAAKDTLIEQDRYALKAAQPFRADELNATDITGQGAEWVEVFYDTRLWERARESTELFNLLVAKGMRQVDIPQGAKGMNVKTNTGSPTVYTGPEGNDVAADGRPEVVASITPLTTGEVEKNAAQHLLATAQTFTFDEDSLIGLAQFLNTDLSDTLAEALESALINGDTTATASSNINLIDGTPAGGLEKPLYLAWDGLRHNPLVDYTARASDNAAAALDMTDYENTVALFPNAIRADRKRMLFVLDYDTESATRLLPELLTQDVAGNRATIFAGDIGPLFKVDTYTSGFLALSNGSGMISATAGNNTQGQILCVYAPYWQYGRKRAITIETDRDILAQATVFVASVRHILAARGDGAATITYDVTV
jgi:hypothetical protein